MEDAQGTALSRAMHGDNGEKGKDIKAFFIIAIITIVVILLCLSAMIYIDSLTFDGPLIQTPTSQLVKASVTDGFKFTFMAVSAEVQWSDVTILLDDGYNGTQWETLTEDLDDGTRVSTLFEPNSLGLLTIYCNVTDILGNGYVNQGDIIILKTGSLFFDPMTTYTFVIMYEPTDSEMCHFSFNG